MTLRHCGVVDSEDGLLLFGDAGVLQRWRGTEEETGFIDRVAAAVEQDLPGLNIRIGEATGVIWDIEGPGTTDVYCGELSDTVLLIRSWTDDGEFDEESDFALGYETISSQNAFAEFEVSIASLAIIWPTEPGNCIQGRDPGNYFLATDDMMTETSGMLLPVLNGRYECFFDTIVNDWGEARRCLMVRK